MEHRRVLRISTIVLAAAVFSLVIAKPAGMAYARHHGYGGPGVNVNLPPWPHHGSHDFLAEAHHGETGGRVESHLQWGEGSFKGNSNDNSGGGSDNSGGGSGGSDSGGGGGGGGGGSDSGGGGDSGGG